ncbi:MAG: hypothetical protein JSR33_09150 [Proteobacteria bacterium]|nr:hypothetical protein [Pseudomonadota bacterium]
MSLISLSATIRVIIIELAEFSQNKKTTPPFKSPSEVTVSEISLADAIEFAIEDFNQLPKLKLFSPTRFGYDIFRESSSQSLSSSASSSLSSDFSLEI